jgi:hypothetical protein
MASKKLGIALALLLSATSVALAQTPAKQGPEDAAPTAATSVRHQPMHTRRLYMHTRRLYLYAPSGLEQNQSAAIASPSGDTSRVAALHDCSVAASKWSFSAWQSTQLAVYRDCMTAHGQVE